jgi:hypothetical protein
MSPLPRAVRRGGRDVDSPRHRVLFCLPRRRAVCRDMPQLTWKRTFVTAMAIAAWPPLSTMRYAPCAPSCQSGGGACCSRLLAPRGNRVWCMRTTWHQRPKRGQEGHRAPVGYSRVRCNTYPMLKRGGLRIALPFIQKSPSSASCSTASSQPLRTWRRAGSARLGSAQRLCCAVLCCAALYVVRHAREIVRCVVLFAHGPRVRLHVERVVVPLREERVLEHRVELHHLQPLHASPRRHPRAAIPALYRARGAHCRIPSHASATGRGKS